MKLKNTLALSLAAVMAAGLTACGSSADTASAAADSTAAESTEAAADTTAAPDGDGDPTTLTVAMECAYAPYNWTQNDDANGAVEIRGSSDYAYGYDVMMAKKIGEALGQKVQIVKLDWDSLIPAVMSGDVDCVIAGQSITAERDKVGLILDCMDEGLILLDEAGNVLAINRAARKSTRYYIDEMHLLLKEEQTAAYTVEIWKRFRKWGGIPTGITQNVKVRPDRALCKAV